MPGKYVVLDNDKLVIERLVGEISHAELIEHKKQQLNDTSPENIWIEAEKLKI